MKRIEWIDVARCIAIISVIIGHSLARYSGGYIYNLIYLYHLPVFFILSGYLYRKKSLKHLFLNDLKYLLVPYFAVNLIKTFIYILLKCNIGSLFFTMNVSSLKSLVEAAIYGSGLNVKVLGFNVPSTGAVWFLLAMFFANQLFNYIMNLRFSKSDLVFKGLFIFIFVGIGFGVSHYIALPFSINAAFVSQGFMYLGYLFKNFGLFDKIGNGILIILGIFWMFSASIGTFYLVTATAPDTMVLFTGSISSSVCIIRFAIFLESVLNKYQLIHFKKFITFIGAQSLTMLCFHLIDMDAIAFYNDIIVYVSNNSSKVLAYALAMLYRILFAILMTYLVRFIPILRELLVPREFSFLKKK